jgi:hypothetical protein
MKAFCVVAASRNPQFDAMPESISKILGIGFKPISDLYKTLERNQIVLKHFLSLGDELRPESDELFPSQYSQHTRREHTNRTRRAKFLNKMAVAEKLLNPMRLAKSDQTFALVRKDRRVGLLLVPVRH